MSSLGITDKAVSQEEAANKGYFEQVSDLQGGSAKAIKNFIKTDGTKTDIATLFETLKTEQGTYDFQKAHLAYALNIAGATEEQVLNAIAFLTKAKKRTLAGRVSFREEETGKEFFEGIMKPQTKAPKLASRKQSYRDSIDTAMRTYRQAQLKPISPEKDVG